MATEYHHLPSQQGKMPLDLIADSDPWLIAATNNLSLDNSWSPKNNHTLGLEVWGSSASVILPLENGGKLLSNESSWNSLSLLDNGINNKTKLNAFPSVPKNFVSTSSKIDAWSIQSPAPSPAKQIKVPKQQVVQQIQEEQSEEEDEEAAKVIEDELAIQNRYKTELCKSYTETGVCRYGTKCQFAHGKEEVRPILRHPKYKTETCKTFHSTGTCPYGIRCRFIHTRAKEDAPVPYDDESKVTPPPGIAGPGWSKSWASADVVPQKKSSSKKHGLGKIPLVEAVPDF